jgi:hypothetical protein
MIVLAGFSLRTYLQTVLLYAMVINVAKWLIKPLALLQH